MSHCRLYALTVYVKAYADARLASKMLGEILALQTGAFSEMWLDAEKAASLDYWSAPRVIPPHRRRRPPAESGQADQGRWPKDGEKAAAAHAGAAAGERGDFR